MKTDSHLLVLTGLLAIQEALLASSVCTTVVDPAGLPLPGAAVKIVSLLRVDKRFSVSTDQQGRACAGDVPEGLYSVEASLAGFLNVKYYPVRVSFPGGVNLSFQLPFGEITEGGVQAEAILSGTLEDKGKPLSGIKICLFDKTQTAPTGCTVTNDLGEYALCVPPGVYRLELSKLLHKITSIKVDLSNAGYYRNKVSFPAPE